MKDSLITTVVSRGKVTLMTLPRIAQMLRRGLTDQDYEALALTADEHRMTVEALMAAALESRGRR